MTEMVEKPKRQQELLVRRGNSWSRSIVRKGNAATDGNCDAQWEPAGDLLDGPLPAGPRARAGVTSRRLVPTRRRRW